MVAFIGAVICIIAAVHTGTTKAARQQPAADNRSVYPAGATQPPATRGSAARAGSLGALHGSEVPESEAPTFHIGLGGLDGVTGLTGHDPAVSRLICTPIPAGECNPKNFQQQADDPSLYAGEDWGYLRTTADELRQTVMQQREQIQTDQRTIRELTGKLSECEKGLKGRGGVADRRGGAVGLWGSKSPAEGAQLERVMVRDSPASAPDHMLTVRAVDELEKAISQLKDRIERLEADINLFPHNQTDINTSAVVENGGKSVGPERLFDPGHNSGTDRPWRMEDLEGELERKVELLEKERKALRLETERHRQEMDRGISDLHHRLSGLEEANSFPEGFRLSFPSRTNYMYAVVKQSIPKLLAFTICLWLRPTEVGIGTPLSYAVPEQPNELLLLQGLHTPMELLINDKVARLPLNLSRGSWQHICVTWSQKGGEWMAYQGGKLRGEGHGLAAGHDIRPGGVLILGQEQDSLGGGFDSTQALVGELSQMGLWDRVLSTNQVASLARCGMVTQGHVVPWTERGMEVYGGATKYPGEPCSKHSRSSK
ncbi:neuronal pentraxin receptor-like [Dunckerocampus dactyliophorus]|uniref:neuronal pentraxin receptor-like n=1 Tax=Dunckerocampus dactyliophorus TaxID=161453 RepID=UPI002407581A|nr:neuronal pentraxin receptor-like [Dunckerocampus dactyliophorus]